MKIFLLTFFLVGFLSISCEKTVTIEIPEKAPRLALNSVLEKGDSIWLLVFKTRHILSPGGSGSNILDSYVVKDATPVLFENNVAVDTLVYIPLTFSYRSVKNTVIRDGINYTYKVSAPGYTPVEANSILPSQSTIAGVARVKNAKTTSFGNLMDEITVRFDDPATNGDFYVVQIFQAGSTSSVYCVSTSDKDLERIGENADPLSSDNCYDGRYLLLSDANFNGRQKELKVFVDSDEVQDIPDGNGNIMRPYVKVLRITADYFKYLKSYGNYLWGADNPFAEPVNVFTNVKNGLGIFALTTAAVDTLR